jgi:glutaryl-CoA dehydrogenase
MVKPRIDPTRELDLYGIDELLTEEERMIRDSVWSFAAERIVPNVVEHYRKGTFPVELMREMGELGVLGANIEGYGCAGLSDVAYGLALQSLERADTGVRSAASVQGALVMFPIYKFGTDAQKERWLPKLARGEAIGCFGLTEPNHGSDPASMETHAVRKDGVYVLNGTKQWITNGSLADVALIWAKEDGIVRGFLVERGMRGFSTQEEKTKLSLRASDTSTLFMEDVEVPEENVLPGVSGMRGPQRCLSQARYGIAWGVVGAAQACFLKALEYVKERHQFRKPIASFQLVQAKLADMATELTKAQLLALQLGRLKEQGKADYVRISMAKRNNVYWALEIARMARELLGANGICDEYEVMRHSCNLESVKTYEGTHEIHTLILGQALTGHPAYR